MESNKNNNININETFSFGKHKNKRVVDVFQTDKGYIQWVVRVRPDAATEPLLNLCVCLVENHGIVPINQSKPITNQQYVSKPENNCEDRGCEGKPLCKGECESGYCIFKIGKGNVLEVYKNNRDLIYNFFFSKDCENFYHTRIQNLFMMNQFFQDKEFEFECAVCLEKKLVNIKLLCSHGFCSDCVSEISKQSGRDIKCPICRKENINFLKDL